MKAGKFFGFAIILSVSIGVLFLASCAPKPVKKPPKQEPASPISAPERIEYRGAPTEETVQETPETPTQTRAWVPLPSKETPALPKEEILPMQMRDVPVLPPELPEPEEEEEGDIPPFSSGTGSSGPVWGPPPPSPASPPPPISFETTGPAPAEIPPVTPPPTPPAVTPPTPISPPPPPDNTSLPSSPPGVDIPDFVPQTNTTGPGTEAERAYTPLPPFTPITNTTGPTENQE